MQFFGRVKSQIVLRRSKPGARAHEIIFWFFLNFCVDMTNDRSEAGFLVRVHPEPCLILVLDKKPGLWKEWVRERLLRVASSSISNARVKQHIPKMCVFDISPQD
jgi:hypothetical protein